MFYTNVNIGKYFLTFILTSFTSKSVDCLIVAFTLFCIFEDKSLITIDKKVYKHSFNIIDLIEVGDYVNGYKVSDKESTLLCTNVKGIDKSGYHIPISQYGEGIETIVTKEQFEIAKYEVIK